MELGRAVLALKKYSWSNNGEHGKAAYNHLTADNIFLVLEGEQNRRGQLKLQIIQGTSCLAEIDLAKHIDIAISTRETFQRIGRHIADKQLPTYGVVSGNKLAITYRPDDGQARRMQIALVAPEDCSKVATHLRHRGMIFVDAAQRTTSRPSTAGSDLRSVHTSASGLFTKPPAVRPSLTQVHTSPSSYTPSFLAQRSADTFLSRDEDIAPRVPRLDQPTASQVFPRAVAFTRGAAGTRSDPLAVGRSDDSASSLSTLFADRSSGGFGLQSNGLHTSFTQPMTSVRAPSTSLWMPPHTLEEGRAPEREPQPERASHERSRSSSILELPPLPKPRLANSITKRTPSLAADSSGGHEITTPSRVVSLKVDTTSSEIMTRSKRKHQEIEAEREQHHRKSMPPPQLLTTSEASRSSPRDMNELLYGKRPRVAGVDAPGGTLQDNQHQKTFSSDPIMSTKSTTQPSQSIDLATWVTLDEKERMNTLERSIIDMLGNKDFASLCEAMSTCWSRLALGL